MSDDPEVCLSDRLALIEALLFEFLRFSRPADALPFAAARLAAATPGWSEAEIMERAGW
jgi:hypothetical protein